MRRAIIVLLFLTARNFCSAQDFIFTQNLPGILYQNPGFTGTEVEPTIRTSYQGGLAYNMLFASFDTYSYKLHGGLGGYLGQRWYSDPSDVFTTAGLIYSPSLKIHDSVFVKPSIQYGISNYYTEYWGPLPHTSSQNNYTWGGLGAGLNIIYRNSFLGFVIHNLNQPIPDVSYGRIDMDFIFSAGTLINFTADPYMNKRMFLFPSIFYGTHSGQWYYNAGAEFRKSAFICGFRVINYSPNGMYYDNAVDFFSIMLGLRFSKLRIALSRDFSFDNSNDSRYEFTLCFLFNRNNDKNKNSGLYNIFL